MPRVTIDARVWHDQVNFTQKLVVEICCNCAVPFAMPVTLRDAALDDHSLYFYCPNGHSQHFTGKTDAEKQRARAEAAERRATLAEGTAKHQRERANAAERSAIAYKGVATKARKRAGHGICPAGCNRQFPNLQRHMISKHPGYADAPVTPGG